MSNDAEEWVRKVRDLRNKTIEEKNNRYEFRPPSAVHIYCTTCARNVDLVGLITNLNDLLKEISTHEEFNHVGH